MGSTHLQPHRTETDHDRSRRPGRPKGQSHMEPVILVAVRQRFKLSQVSMAKIVGVSRATLSMWENGHVPVPKYAAQVITQLEIAQLPVLERKDK